MLLHPHIEHTLLSPVSTLSAIMQLCSEAKQHHFAAVCVPPPFVKKCRESLLGTNVKVATVIGYPFGYAAVEAKLAEILLSIVDGADELDVVVNFTAIKNNDWQYISNEINHLMTVLKSRDKVVKVTLDSAWLNEDEIIKCCQLYGAAGVDYVNTSTVVADKGVTTKTVELIRKSLPDQVNIKASGHIETKEFAWQLIAAGALRLGCSEGLLLD